MTKLPEPVPFRMIVRPRRNYFIPTLGLAVMLAVRPKKYRTTSTIPPKGEVLLDYLRHAGCEPTFPLSGITVVPKAKKQEVGE